MNTFEMQKPITDVAKLAHRFNRAVELTKKRPEVALGTSSTRIELQPGLSCRIKQGPWTLETGLSSSMGAERELPDPGMLARGALGSCFAMTFALYAARRGIALQRMEVEVSADYDGRGMLGSAEVPPGYSEVRVSVVVESEASEELLRQIGQDAAPHSPFNDVFCRAQRVVTEVRAAEAGYK